MIGKLIATTIRVVTLPIDAANAGVDMLCGGDGSKESRTDGEDLFSFLENLRDRVAEAAQGIDRE